MRRQWVVIIPKRNTHGRLLAAVVAIMAVAVASCGAVAFFTKWP